MVIGRGALKSLPNLKFAGFERNICVNGKANNQYQLKALEDKLEECYKAEVITMAPVIKATRPGVVNCAPCANPGKETDKMKKQIYDLKLKIAAQEFTIMSFKKELSKKTAEAKVQSDNVEKCNQKLQSVTQSLSEVNTKFQIFEGTPKTETKFVDNMSREQCLAALKESISDKEMCGKENAHLMALKNLLNSNSLVCDVTAWAKTFTCNAVNFKVTSENQKIGSIKNKDQSTVNKRINELLILNQHVLYLPLGIGQILTAVTKLTVSNCHLTKLNSEALTNLKTLKVLNLSTNKISDIIAQNFENLNTLEKLDLSKNQIGKLNVGVFHALVELKVLKLSDNKLVEIDSGVVSRNFKLNSISLQNNQLEYISATLIDPLKSLNMIDFSNNVCINSVFQQASFANLKKVLSSKCSKPIKMCCRFERESAEKVTCRTNQFTFLIKGSKVSTVKSLEECTLRDSLIDSRVIDKNNRNAKDVTVLKIIDEHVNYLPNELVNHFMVLEKLIVDNSKLLEVHREDFEGLIFLTYLQLTNNELTKLEPELFEDILHLEHLDISHNKIVELPPRIFQKMSRLKFLKVSHNELVKLEADLFPKQNSLKEIYFDENSNLYEVDGKLFRFLSKLEVIDFRGNPCIGKRYPDDVTLKELPSKAIYC